MIGGLAKLVMKTGEEKRILGAKKVSSRLNYLKGFKDKKREGGSRQVAVMQRHGCQPPLKSEEEEINSVSGTSVNLCILSAFVAKKNQNLILRQIFV